jgi:AcrR family transcriptional regulator
MSFSLFSCIILAVTRETPPSSATLQERKHEFVRGELASAAWGLFAEKGYEATTVAEIAETAGVSRRTFFRYYASKEDVLVETSDEFAEDMLAAVARRPPTESPIAAIRHAIVPVLEASLADRERSRAIIRLLRESPSLRRAMLDRHARMEERLALQIAGRMGVDPLRDSTPALAAFLTRALIDTAFNVWYDQEREDVVGLVDELFARLADLARGI